MQDAAQTSNATAVASSLAEGFADCFAAALLLGLGENAFGLRTNFVHTGARDFGGKAAHQLLRNIRVQLRFDLGPVRILAAQNPPLEHAFIEGVFKEISDEFEMMAGLILDATLGVASIVAGEAIPAAPAGEGMKEAFAFDQLAEAQIEQAGAVTIDQHDAQAGKSSQELGQGF